MSVTRRVLLAVTASLAAHGGVLLGLSCLVELPSPSATRGQAPAMLTVSVVSAADAESGPRAERARAFRVAAVPAPMVMAVAPLAPAPPSDAAEVRDAMASGRGGADAAPGDRGSGTGTEMDGAGGASDGSSTPADDRWLGCWSAVSRELDARWRGLPRTLLTRVAGAEVVIGFTLDDGVLTELHFERSSGRARLDAAARQLFALPFSACSGRKRWTARVIRGTHD